MIATLADEVATQAKIDLEKVVRDIIVKITLGFGVDDQRSMSSKGLSGKTCNKLMRIDEQSLDIADGVHVDKNDLGMREGKHGIVLERFG